MLEIRKASADDIVLIRELTMQIWPQTYAAILSKEQIDYMLELMYNEASLQRQFHDGNQFIIVYNSSAPVGFASYSEVKPFIYKLHKIYVLSFQQGRGTGRFIIEHIISTILPKGATALQLNVNRHNNAKQFYEKLGFEVIAEENIDIGHGYYMNDYIMERKLNAQ